MGPKVQLWIQARQGALFRNRFHPEIHNRGFKYEPFRVLWLQSKEQ